MFAEQEQYLCPVASEAGRIVWAANSELVIYKRGQFEPVSLGVHTDTIRAISMQGDSIATGGEDKQVIVWKQAEKKWTPSWIFLHSKRIMAVQFDNTGSLFFSDKFGEFYQVSKDNQIKLMFGHLSAVSSVFFGGDFLVSADRDEKIRLSKYPQVEFIEAYLFGHKRYVCHIVGNNANQRLVSGGADGRVICWDISDREKPVQIWQVALEDGPMNSLILASNDDVYLVRAAEPNRIEHISSNGEKMPHISKEYSIQTLHVMEGVCCIDDKSHLHLKILNSEETFVSRGPDVPGVAISFMKIVHHENVDAHSSFKKKRSEG